MVVIDKPILKLTSLSEINIPKPIEFKDLPKDKQKEAELNLCYCSIGVGFLDVGTKQLVKLGNLTNRDEMLVFINKFKELENQFNKSDEYKKDRNDVENLFYIFLTQPEKRKRIVNFALSLK